MTLKQLFPKYLEWLSEIHDPRQQGKCRYPLNSLLWLSIFMMLSGQGSRNQYNEQLSTEETHHLLEQLFELELPSLPHGDTLAHLWKQLEPKEIEKLKWAMLHSLLRRGYLKRFRDSRGRYLLALDGTELYRWSKPHCEQCLRAASGPDKSLQYFHRVLELKLVSSDGMCLSLGTEFIENESPDVEKQDCERKAAKRLLQRFKHHFPRMKVLLLADGLYPNGPLFALCEAHQWNYLFTLPDGCLPSVWQEFETLTHMPLNALGVKENDSVTRKGEQIYRWVNQMSYQGEAFDGFLNVFDVLLKKEQRLQRIRAFATNLKLTERNLQRIEQLGQQRWKIENQGFDAQKNHGYALEHTWSRHPNAMKVVYHLIQIAHLINQFLICCDFLQIGLASMTLKTFFKLYLFAFTQTWTIELQGLFDDALRRQVQWRH